MSNFPETAVIGTIEELSQSQDARPAAATSSFAPEDLISNTLGLLFVKRSDESIEFETYLRTYLQEVAKLFEDPTNFQGKYLTADDVALIKSQSPTGRLEDVRIDSPLYTNKAHNQRVEEIKNVIDQNDKLKWTLDMYDKVKGNE
ncbi:MAG: hypothetical protein LBM75_08105 [Myxococcales bacterium]|nr:hypothetical protein [Myxococcales bacterium]